MLTADGESATSIADSFGQFHQVAKVNLLPPEIIAVRAFKKTQGWLAAATFVLLFVLVGVYLLQVSAKNQASDRLTDSQARGRTLKVEQAKYADVPRVYAAIESAQTARETAMSQDVEWYRYLTDFSLAIPANVWLTSLEVGVRGGQPATAAPGAAASAATNPVQAAGIGDVKVSGVALQHTDVAAWLDMLGRQRGLADPYFTTSTKAKIGTKDVVNYSSTALVTPDALSRRFDRKAG